jgi:NodT family efflux transporter outer membrane factor (OMF) lipoprotein
VSSIALNNKTRRLAIVLMGLATAACMVGPNYKRPDPPAVPQTYKEPLPTYFKEGESWKVAQPNDSVPRGSWWDVFQNPSLNALEVQVVVNNQTIRQFEAQYREARAVIGVTRAGLFPTVTGTAGVVGTNQAGARSSSGGSSSPPASALLTLSGGLSYDTDLWGRIHRTLEGNVGTAQASEADLENAKLSAQALLAEDYYLLCGLDAEKKLLDDTVEAYVKALDLTKNRYNQGVASRLDVVQAQNQIDTARSASIDTQVLRAQYEHAIAVLIGKTPAEFSIPVTPVVAPPPSIPGVVPSALLERRPDIAGAERRVMAANAQIGVAQAAFYPSLTFSASGGFEGTSLLNWLSWPSRVWSLGPTLAQTIFEAGGRRAFKKEMIDAYDATVASYRQTVLTAFQNVEDDLSSLRILEAEEKQQQQAVASAALSTELSVNQYKGGIVAYLQVITAEEAELGARVALLSVQNRRIQSSVLLAQAIGGGWDTSQLPSSQDLLPPGKGVIKKGFLDKQFPGPVSDTPPQAQPTKPVGQQ